jgi:hypothetical protein
MAVVISPYNISTFNNLPGFEVAGPKFDAVDGKTIISDIMTPLFRKHNAEKVLGLQLLHQHFQLYPGERLVDFNGTSVPIKPGDDQVSNLTTTIWSLEHSGDRFQLQPLEFMLIQATPIWMRLLRGTMLTFRCSSPPTSPSF